MSENSSFKAKITEEIKNYRNLVSKNKTFQGEIISKTNSTEKNIIDEAVSNKTRKYPKTKTFSPIFEIGQVRKEMGSFTKEVVKYLGTIKRKKNRFIRTEPYLMLGDAMPKMVQNITVTAENGTQSWKYEHAEVRQFIVLLIKLAKYRPKNYPNHKNISLSNKTNIRNF